MKKMTRILSALLCLAMLLSFGALADAHAGWGLNSFEDVATMTSFTFSDVNSTLWSFTGIKAVYDKGILLGYQDGTYRPKSNVTWGQAIVIAARIHAVYNGNNLREDYEPGQYWYEPQLNYCLSHGMIPADCPQGVNLDRVVIPRYALAYIFSRTIDLEDMPVISDRAITDLASIPAAYVDSVKLMYASGIMNGWSDYSFGGDRLTNREQIAVVVSRLLVPANRVGYDSKANADMRTVESNLENDAAAVQVGSDYYCVYKLYTDTVTEIYSLYCVKGENDSTAVFTARANERISNVSAYNGKVYFCTSTPGGNKGTLLCYDPATGGISTVFDKCAVKSYCFYDGRCYALLFTRYAEPKPDKGTVDLSGWKYAFGVIENGQFEQLLSDMDYYEVMYFVPYGWNGCIYFKYHDQQNDTTNLYEYEIARANLNLVSDVNINTSFFEDHVMYFMCYDSDKLYDLGVYALSLQAPAVVKKIGELPAATDKSYRSIYKYGDTIYCLSSTNRNIYSMDVDGATRLALICGGVYSACCFTQDSMILIPNSMITSNVNEIKFYDAKTLADRTSYGDWLGMSCYYRGARFVPDDGQPVWSSGDETVSTVTDLSITVPEMYMRGSDLVIRSKYVNNLVVEEFKNTRAVITLRMYVVKVYQGDELVAYDVNKMQSMELDPHDVHTFTFVIGHDDILKNIDLSADDISVEIVPTYDVQYIESGKQA